MKQTFTLLVSFIAGIGTLAAQNNARMNQSGPIATPVSSQTPKVISVQAQGDTTFLFDGFYVYDIAGNLPGTFAIQTEDIDAAQVAVQLQSSSFGPASDFVFFFEENPGSPLSYGHPDSVFFAGATSWLDPLGQASNWLEMGPIPVPATGGTLKWRHNMPDGQYRDGYEVLVNTSGINFTDFTNPAIFTVADMSPSTAGDTVNTPYNVFAQRSVDVSAFAGQDIYIAFHHNANDMFILYLTDIMMIEGPAGLEENQPISFNTVMPNPANENATISYNLQNAGDVVFTMYNVNGQIVRNENLIGQNAGLNRLTVNTADLAAGVYYFTMTSNGFSKTMKMVVNH